MSRGAEPVIARIDKGMAVTVEHRLADVLLMECPATAESFVWLFARLPGLAMAVAANRADKIVIAVRDGTTVTLNPAYEVDNGGVFRPDLCGVVEPLYLQWARRRWTLGIADGRIEWDPETGSRYLVTVGTWCSGGVSRAGERAEFLHPFPKPDGVR